MLTQTIMVNLTQSKLSAIIMRSEEKGREIQFEIIDAAGEAVDLTEYAVKFIMLKPDENIVMTDAVGGVVTQTEQMTTAKGAGYYCIRILDDDTVIYSGQGKVLIDDHVVDDETLQSISEVDGLIFPDDFLTTDSPVALIDDTDTSAETTWSSYKISGEISTSVTGLIDDNSTDTDTTWSSDKISTELGNINPDIIYSNIAQKIGTWFGRDLWKKTFEDDIASYVNGASYYHDLPAGAVVVMIEPNYCRYQYGGVWYKLAGYDLCGGQSMHVKMEETADDVARIQATYTIGGSLNGNPCTGVYTVYYTWSN